MALRATCPNTSSMLYIPGSPVMPGEGIFWGGHAQAFTTLKYIILFFSFYVSSMRWEHLLINFEITCVSGYTVHKSHLRIEEKGGIIRCLLSMRAIESDSTTPNRWDFCQFPRRCWALLHLQAFPQAVILAWSPLPTFA